MTQEREISFADGNGSCIFVLPQAKLFCLKPLMIMTKHASDRHSLILLWLVFALVHSLANILLDGTIRYCVLRWPYWQCIDEHTLRGLCTHTATRQRKPLSLHFPSARGTWSGHWRGLRQSTSGALCHKPCQRRMFHAVCVGTSAGPSA